MTNHDNFDELARQAMATNAMDDLNKLFGAAFALPEWLFISRGELPNAYPYVASNAAVADNQPMIRAFTDTDRLMRFAQENNLTEANGSCQTLTIPIDNIIPYLEGFIEQGVYGIWFNSDSQSSDFYIPIKQLQPIQDHLSKINGRQKDAPQPAEKQSGQQAGKQAVATLRFDVEEGLMMPSGEIRRAPYSSHVFWCVPSEWLENGQIKAECLRTFEQELSGGNSESVEGAFYVAVDYTVKVFSPEAVKKNDWQALKNSDESNTFFIASHSGDVKQVSAEEFQANLNSSFQSQTTLEARQEQHNLANFGISQTPAGEFDLNLTINKVGAVNFEMSIAPFYEALVPLLQDFQGMGEYVTLLKFETVGMSELVENIAENSHGAYLQIRRFHYLNPKNNVPIGVNSIHSNHLRHVESNAELLISLELCKNLDNQTGVFYHAFQGPRADVLQLQAAIDPILQSVGYQSASQ